MASFTIEYKKILGQRLKPLGYSFWKSVFYREADNIICFFVYAKKNWPLKIPGTIQMFVEAAPYCADLQTNGGNLNSDGYEPQENGTNILDIHRMINPEIFTEEKMQEYNDTRIKANTEETMINSIANLSNDLGDIILPYIHKYEDLEFYYNEEINGSRFGKERIYLNYFMYGLSLKLHKYSNAIPYIDHKLKWHNDLVHHSKAHIEALKNGNIAAVFSVPKTESEIKRLLKNRPDFIEVMTIAATKAIDSSEKELIKYHAIKEVLLANDYTYLDGLVKETENNSRNYIHEMLGIRT